MSDDIAGNFLSEESESAMEARVVRGPEGADPLATGLVVQAAAQSPQFIAEASAYLRHAQELVRQQVDKLREEDPLIPLAMGEARLRRLSLQLRITFFTIAGLTLFTAAAAMIWGAARSHNVVVEVFDVPPSFVAHGITGRAVASGLLDELTRLRNATRSSYTPLEAQTAWASDIKIIVPDTGISIADIDHVLHARLGHDLHVQGELMETAAGRISLRVRGDGVAARRFDGLPDALPRLTTQAAEWVYGQSQPHEYAAYLTDNGRDQEAIDFLPGAFAAARDDEERAALANTWGVAYNDLNKIAAAAVKYRAAMTLKPRYWRAWSNLIDAMPFTEGEEAAFKEAKAFQAASAAAPVYDKPELRMLAPIAIAMRDKMLSVRSQIADLRVTPGGTGTVTVAPSLAEAYAELHDWANARRFIDLAAPDDPMKKAAAQQVAAAEAVESGDFKGAIPPLETLHGLRKASPLIQSYVFNDCMLGYAYGMAGRMADADANFADNGRWSDCLAWRGAVLAHAGRASEADRVWAEAIASMPDLPEAYLQRGLWRASQQDLVGAALDFSAAHARAPQFADALKAWGDVLAAMGLRQEARAKYDDAMVHAPAWAALMAARAR